MIVRHNTHSRMGLLGNPSDGFGGKTIAVLIDEFCASAALWESPRLEIKHHPVHDPFTFESLQQLHETAERDGYYGGTRLVYATCKHFYEYCQRKNIPIRDANFTIEYDTDIPRQVGLGGSSAIVVSVLKALMEFYEISEGRIPKAVQPQLALAVEQEELEIKAGLQDRVAQIYGGLVYMDFAPELMEAQGHGRYERLPMELLPPLYVAYVPHPTIASGKAHNLVRYRYDNGDAEVREAMREFAEFAERGREALEGGDVEELGKLMDLNFDLRRRIYGDGVIGEENLRMVDIARGHGLSAKFTGSGGAITGILPDGAAVEDIEQEFGDHGYRFMRATAVAQ